MAVFLGVLAGGVVALYLYRRHKLNDRFIDNNDDNEDNDDENNEGELAEGQTYNENKMPVNTFTTSLNSSFDVSKDFLEMIHADKQNSVGFSFLSLQEALIICYYGTNNNELINSYLKIIGNMNMKNYVQFNKTYNDLKIGIICNSLWYVNDLELNNDFKENMLKFAELNNTNNMQNDIEKWITEKTNNNINKIPNVADVPMVIVNVIHFNDVWKVKFLKENTKEDIFYGLNEKKCTKQFMFHRKINCMYHKDYEYAAISLDYEHGFNMIFVLPNKNKLMLFSENEIETLYDKMNDEKVSVLIPKFEIETEINITNILKNMNMNNIFEQDHNLIFNNKPIRLDKIIQKFKINVDEDGTTMSAVTMVISKGVGCVKTFNANHTFNFYLMHTDSKTIIASGIVSS